MSIHPGDTGSGNEWEFIEVLADPGLRSRDPFSDIITVRFPLDDFGLVGIDPRCPTKIRTRPSKTGNNRARLDNADCGAYDEIIWLNRPRELHEYSLTSDSVAPVAPLDLH